MSRVLARSSQETSGAIPNGVPNCRSLALLSSFRPGSPPTRGRGLSAHSRAGLKFADEGAR